MELCPIASPKGFPYVYDTRLAHRSLEAFRRKYLVLFSKHPLYQLNSPAGLAYFLPSFMSISCVSTALAAASSPPALTAAAKATSWSGVEMATVPSVAAL